MRCHIIGLALVLVEYASIKLIHVLADVHWDDISIRGTVIQVPGRGRVSLTLVVLLSLHCIFVMLLVLEATIDSFVGLCNLRVITSLAHGIALTHWVVRVRLWHERLRVEVRVGTSLVIDSHACGIKW